MTSVKLPKRYLKDSSIEIEDKWFKTYTIPNIDKFYKILQNDDVIIRNMEDLTVFILPIFYLLHGDPYDSANIFSS